MGSVEFRSFRGNGNGDEAAGSLVAQLRASAPGAAEPVLLMVFASVDQALETVHGVLAREFPRAKLLGCSTAGEFTERGDASGTTVVAALWGDLWVSGSLGTGLRAGPEEAVTKALGSVADATVQKAYPHETVVLLLDPLSGNGEEATLIAGALLGPEARLVGGAAGDSLRMTRTVVGYGTDVADDAVAALRIRSRSPFGVGVCHAHKVLAGPWRVTRAEGSRVYTLDGRPAWEIWREATESRAKALGISVDALGDADLGAFLLRFEAGLANGEKLKIRAPLQRFEDGALGFACGVPEGAMLHITESDPTAQLQSARLAAEQARKQLAGPPAGALVFDCICRKLILGAGFDAAVAGVVAALDGAPVAGFETYGEIALDPASMSGFHNTTSVVLAIPKS